MKKLIIGFLICLFATVTYGLDIRPANQLTVAWDPVQVAPNQVAEYNVFVKEAVSGAVEISAGNPTESTSYTVTFPSEGVWYIGVSTSKYQMVPDPDGGPDVRVDSGESAIGWSSDPAYVKDGVTFAGAYLEIPPTMTGLYPQ